MGNKKKKFSYYNDYSTVHFGSSRSGRSNRSSGGSRRRSDDVDHTWCEDCDGTGRCVHCKDGRFPLRKGGTASCGKCRGSLKCHACRGSRIDGKKCNTPTYEETLEANKRGGGRTGTIAKGVASAAIAVYGAYGQPAQGSENTQHRWSESQARSESRRRGDQAADATRDKGSRQRESGQE